MAPTRRGWEGLQNVEAWGTLTLQELSHTRGKIHCSVGANFGPVRGGQ